MRRDCFHLLLSCRPRHVCCVRNRNQCMSQLSWCPTAPLLRSTLSFSPSIFHSNASSTQPKAYAESKRDIGLEAILIYYSAPRKGPDRGTEKKYVELFVKEAAPGPSSTWSLLLMLLLPPIAALLYSACWCWRWPSRQHLFLPHRALWQLVDLPVSPATAHSLNETCSTSSAPRRTKYSSDI